MPSNQSNRHLPRLVGHVIGLFYDVIDIITLFLIIEDIARNQAGLISLLKWFNGPVIFSILGALAVRRACAEGLKRRQSQ